MSLISETFRKGLLRAIKESETSFPKPWVLLNELDTFQEVLDKYAEYYKSLDLEQQKVMSELFWKQFTKPFVEELSNDEAKSVLTLIEKILDDENIPALSLSWYEADGGSIKTVAFGVTDTSSPKPVNTQTLFEAASLSKPVSAAIVLDLVAQGKWDLDIPLAEILDYGPPELRLDPYYKKLTTKMVLGQCSGLPNWFFPESDEKFINEPGSKFSYSGIAFNFLKEAIEEKLEKKWEAIAQEFFAKVNMTNSTFKQLPASHLRDKKEVARAHQADGTPHSMIAPVDLPEIPAGSLLTTANDYMIFLQYCFNNDFLRSKLLTGAITLNPKDFPETSFAESQIKWGLGMGIFTNKEGTIAFHWGMNPGADAFCAINMKTGNSIACFVNSVNGPNVFQRLAEPVVGDMNLVFNLLSAYYRFNAEKISESTDSLRAFFRLVNSIIEKQIDQVHCEVTQPQTQHSSTYSMKK